MNIQQSILKIGREEVCNKQNCKFIIDDSNNTGICYGRFKNRGHEFICDYNALKQVYKFINSEPFPYIGLVFLVTISLIVSIIGVIFFKNFF